MTIVNQTFSNFKILEKIGEGGMGEVYKARDTKLERIVAIKFLPREIAAQDDVKKRFKFEAKAAAALNHPNIATIHQIEEVGNQIFIVMEFVEGQELKQLVESQNSLPIDDVINYAIQIAEGLQAAHKKGIIHRDIKSANIMLTENGQVKIMDFGLAKLTGQAQITKDQSTLGTAAYMSPEQARGEEVDHRTDIWSFGIVLYEMLSGQRPFQGDYELAVLHSIMNKEPKPINELRSDIPPMLVHIVKKALAKESNDRYSKTEDLIAELKARPQASLPVQKIEGEKNRRSIAVLPFADLSREKDQDYFCEGLADEIMNELASFPELRVHGRTSAYSVKSVERDVQKIGSRLGATYILDGSVRKELEQLRITVQLINASDGYQIWSDRYDLVLENIFAIQDEITMTVTDKLKIQLSEKTHTVTVKRHTENPKAYQLYLKGRYFWNRRYEGGLLKALEYFEQAIAEDSNYALAYVGVADSYSVLGFWGYWAPEDAFPNARKAAEQALKINSHLAEAYTTIGGHISTLELDFNSAENKFKKAIQLDPNYAMAHEWYAVLVLLPRREFEKAIEKNRLAESLDPLSMIIGCMTAFIYYFAGHYVKAIKQFNKMLEMDPNYILAKMLLGLAYSEINQHTKAIKELEEAVRLSNGSCMTTCYLGYAYAKNNQHGRAMQMLESLKKSEQDRYVSKFYKAVIHAGLAEYENALELLEQACEEGDTMRLWFRVWPVLKGLHNHPRFEKLLKKMNL